MNSADFLFPSDLSVTPTPLRNVLITGSCASEIYHQMIFSKRQDLRSDFIGINNVGELPEHPPCRVQDYDIQFVQIPLREVLGDEIVAFANLDEVGLNRLYDRAKAGLPLRLDATLKYATRHGLLTVVSNFAVPQHPVARSLKDYGSDRDLTEVIRRLNRDLSDAIRPRDNVYLCDTNAIAASLGKRYTQDDVTSFYSHSSHRRPDESGFDHLEVWNAQPRIEPLPDIAEVYETRMDELFDAIIRQWHFTYRVANQIDQVKLVIFDLDDTLWRGQIAEHYGEVGGWPVEHGWPMGIWETVHHLRARGILTAICSKNEASIVADRWTRTVYEHWLQPEHFAFREIGWNPKAESVGRIIKAASLTAKSVVFVDDNPVERDAIKSAFPEIRTIGSNPYLSRRILLWSAETNVARLTAESAHRETMILKQQEREEARAATSREDFLQNLMLEVTVIKVCEPRDPSYPRLFELLNKTNQFNTTGLRWTSAEMMGFLNGGGKLYGFSVRDKFTSYGIVGVVLYREGRFVQFAMSCRVLGLEIETSIVQYIMTLETRSDMRSNFEGVVVETEVNILCRSLYLQSGFEAVGEGLFRRTGAPADVAHHLAITLAESERA